MSSAQPIRILIVTEPDQPTSYLVNQLARCWHDAGFSVEFTCTLDAPNRADVVVLHLDKTLVPDPYLEFARRHPAHVNGNARSISKELFSQHLVDPSVGTDHPVIIKTKSNYGGMREDSRRAGIWGSVRLSRWTTKVALTKRAISPGIRNVAWRNVTSLGDYPLLDSSRDVPAGVWDNPHLIVERFCPERNDAGAYVVRHWFFLGDREFSRTIASMRPVTKWSRMTEAERQISREEWWDVEVVPEAVVPPRVRSVREDLHLDFGRIDWAYHEGEPVVFDVNKTPSFRLPPAGESELRRRILSLLSDFASGVNAIALKA